MMGSRLFLDTVVPGSMQWSPNCNSGPAYFGDSHSRIGHTLVVFLSPWREQLLAPLADVSWVNRRADVPAQNVL